jgi:hypothetical protein
MGRDGCHHAVGASLALEAAVEWIEHGEFDHTSMR